MAIRGWGQRKAVGTLRGEVSPTQIVRDGPSEAQTGPLLDGPLLVVSVLDGSMEHAAVRRCLRAALSAMEEAREERTPLPRGAECHGLGSESRRSLRDYLEMPVARRPDRIADWHASACGTLVIASDGSTLVVEATGDGSTLLLSDLPSCEVRLTAREREVMRCVEDGLSNSEIARELWIQPTTVRKHLENIFTKLGVGSRTAALSKLHASRATSS